MNCAIHTDTPAVAYCRTCGKPLCAACKRDVRGVIYCEECVAARMSDTMPAASPGAGGTPSAMAPADSGPNPAVAAVLGFIPGVGAMYNGQFAKALVHVVVFISIIWATDRVGFFGMLIPFWIFYMVFDAHQTAKARIMGTAPPDPFGLERLWGPPEGPRAPAAGAAVGFAPAAQAGGAGAAPPQVGAAYAGPSAAEFRNAPVGALILIGMGVLFLMDSFGLFRWHWFGQFWPLILIAMGVWILVRRRPGGGL